MKESFKNYFYTQVARQRNQKRKGYKRKQKGQEGPLPTDVESRVQNRSFNTDHPSSSVFVPKG